MTLAKRSPAQRAASKRAAAAPSPANTRRDALRDQLLSTVDLLKRCRASEVSAGYIEDYIALNWMEWHGGSLRLTTTGENVCRQMSLLAMPGHAARLAA